MTSFCQDKVLTNKNILELKSAGLSKTTIKTMIESSPCNFDVDISNIIALKNKGVDEDILNAIIYNAAHGGHLKILEHLYPKHPALFASWIVGFELKRSIVLVMNSYRFFKCSFLECILYISS